jgi:hypothetical protein
MKILSVSRLEHASQSRPVRRVAGVRHSSADGDPARAEATPEVVRAAARFHRRFTAQRRETLK